MLVKVVVFHNQTMSMGLGLCDSSFTSPFDINVNDIIITNIDEQIIGKYDQSFYNLFDEELLYTKSSHPNTVIGINFVQDVVVYDLNVVSLDNKSNLPYINFMGYYEPQKIYQFHNNQKHSLDHQTNL